MENIELYLKSPFVLIVIIIIFIIKFYDKIQLIMPNIQRRLEKLTYSKTLCNKDKLLEDFIENQITRLNFANATSLTMNERNIKLINHYNEIKDDISWSDFLKIKDYIKNFDSIKGIMTKSIKRRLYFKMTIWILIFVIGISSIFIIAIDNNHPNQTIKLIDNLIGPTFLFAFAEIMFIRERDKLNILKKHDEIIKKINSCA